MGNAFNKDFLRSIRGSLGRFLAIMAIVALGTGFYAGLRMSGPDMRIAADDYYDATSLMDIRVVSTLGMTDDDIEALSQIEGVESVMPAYEADVVAMFHDEPVATRIHSLSDSARLSEVSSLGQVENPDDSYLNRLVLSQGTWPASSDECIVSADSVMAYPVQIGDVITVTESTRDLDQTLQIREFTVVGLASSSYYPCSTNLGSTTLGTGAIKQFMYVPSDAFAGDMPYAEAFLTVLGARSLCDGTDAYTQCVHEVKQRIDSIADYRADLRTEQVKAEAMESIDQAQSEYDDSKAQADAELSDAKSTLDAAVARIEQSERQIQDGWAAYEAGVQSLPSAREQARYELENAQQRLDDAKSQLDDAEGQLEAGWAQAGMTATRAEQAIIAAGFPDPTDASAIEAMAAQLRQAGDEATAQTLDGLAQLSHLLASQREYEQGLASWEQGVSQLVQQRQHAEEQMANAEAQLEESHAQLVDAESQLADVRVQYQEGVEEYERAKQAAQEELDDAQRKIDDARAEVQDIEAASWLVMGRDKLFGAASFQSDSERIDHIAQLFPLIFFLVAALVALTTMTRMVEEERILIGTYKALGYSRAKITLRYVGYGVIASTVGSIVGILVLSQVLPIIIQVAYSIMYSVPIPSVMPIDVNLAMLSAGLGIGITLIATFAAAWKTLAEKPSQLMLPPAPVAGKRIILERIPFLWKRMSFLWKITARNILRYKKRFFMTVIGIAGCTALLLTGLGLHDSISDIIDKQFDEILHYSADVACKDGVTDDQCQQLEGVLGDCGVEGTCAWVEDASMVAFGADGVDKAVYVQAPRDAQAFSQVREFRDRLSGEAVALTDRSVVITEKLASMLGLGVGDVIELAEQDAMGNAKDRHYLATVTALCENYIGNYVFMGKTAYEETFGRSPSYDTVFAFVPTDSQVRASVDQGLREFDFVDTISYNDETIDTYRTMLNSVNMVVVVLVVAAAALAFIVLYNLTNINITERKREVATLKVLGFTRKEVNSYIFRETILLAIIGCLVGLAFGVLLEGFVITSAEVDQVMFGRVIHPLSYVGAFVLTMLFSVLVMLFMRGKLAAVNMVESLKSVE